MDAFTTSDRYPYSRPYRLGRTRASTTCATASRWSIDAYDGSTTFYVFDQADPILDRLSRDVSDAVQGCVGDAGRTCARHVRYPELLLALQAEVYGLYHMTDPEVFYNREDLWTVASDVAATEQSRAGRRSRWSRTSC